MDTLECTHGFREVQMPAAAMVTAMVTAPMVTAMVAAAVVTAMVAAALAAVAVATTTTMMMRKKTDIGGCRWLRLFAVSRAQTDCGRFRLNKESSKQSTQARVQSVHTLYLLAPWQVILHLSLAHSQSDLDG